MSEILFGLQFLIALVFVVILLALLMAAWFLISFYIKLKNTRDEAYQDFLDDLERDYKIQRRDFNEFYQDFFKKYRDIGRN